MIAMQAAKKPFTLPRDQHRRVIAKRDERERGAEKRSLTVTADFGTLIARENDCSRALCTRLEADEQRPARRF